MAWTTGHWSSKKWNTVFAKQTQRLTFSRSKKNQLSQAKAFFTRKDHGNLRSFVFCYYFPRIGGLLRKTRVFKRNQKCSWEPRYPAFQQKTSWYVCVLFLVFLFRNTINRTNLSLTAAFFRASAWVCLDYWSMFSHHCHMFHVFAFQLGNLFFLRRFSLLIDQRLLFVIII